MKKLVFNFYASDSPAPHHDGRFSEGEEYEEYCAAAERAMNLCEIWDCDYVWLQISGDKDREQVFRMGL